MKRDTGMTMELDALSACREERHRARTASPDRAALQAIRLVFDRTFYLARYADVAASGLDPLDHFLTAGLGEGRSPCVLFDPDFYLRQPGAPESSEHLFLHYLRTGIAAGLDPHPLLDARFYANQLPVLPAGTNPLTHLLGAGRRENRRPNPLFDAAYYRRRQKGSDQALHPLIHYATSGWHERLQPHPLFDPAAYLEERPDVAAAGVDPLAHYLHVGRFERTRPNWLFDADHYVACLPEALAPEAALLHYAVHASGSGRSPHPLFDAAHYLRQHPDLARSGEDPFLHFLEFGLDANQDPHPLFDGWFYRSQNRDVAESGVPLFMHYVQHGAREGRDPNPFFPAAIYLVRHPQAAAEAAGPLAHFLATPETHLEPLCDAFDPDYYQACNPGCAEATAAGMPPLSHYLSVGRARQLSPVIRPIDLHPWTMPAEVVAGPEGDVAAPILLVLHEASHGDAPRAALEAVRQMVNDKVLCCRIVIRRDGPLRAAFAALAPTLVIHADEPADGTAQLADILYSFRAASADGVVMVTSASMPDAVALAARLRLRLLPWLHEMPLSIDSLLGGSETMRGMEQAATRILTASVTARDALVERYALPQHQVAVLADGVAAPGTTDPRETSRALRDRLGLPPDALVVVGSGGVEFRNGTDLFIRVGHQVAVRGSRDGAADSALRQAFFVWVGPADDPLFAALCRNDIQRLGIGDRVRLLGPQEEAAHLLQGADLFLMSARDATTGTAVLEALSGGLPVVGFPGCAGSGLTGGNRPIEVPYLDVDAMADAVMIHGNRPMRRTRNIQRRAMAGPSWSSWHQGIRRLLAESYGIPMSGSTERPVTPMSARMGAHAARPAHRSSRPVGDVMRMRSQITMRPGLSAPAAAASIGAE